MIKSIARDVRFSLRTLAKSPVFASVAILSLALGVGANTAIFTLMDQVLYRMLPVPHPEELVLFDQPGPNQGSVWLDNAFSYPMYQDLRDHNQVFSSMLARYPLSMSVAYRGQTGRADGELVSGNYFEVLGVQAVIGRTITQDDDRTPGAHPVAFLTHGYWKRQFGGAPSILNQTLLINGYPMTVVGIGPPGFQGVEVGRAADVMTPIMMKAQMTPTWNGLDNRRTMWLNVIARIKLGVSREQADAGINVAYHQNLELEVNELKRWPQKDRQRFLKKRLTLLPGQRGQASLAREFSAP